MVRVLGSLACLLAIILLVGFGVLNAQIGGIAVLVLFIVSGIGWRAVKIFTGAVLVFLAFF